MTLNTDERTPKTGAQRVAELRARRKAAGLVNVQVEVHRDDAPAVRELAAKLAARRQRAANRKTQSGGA